MGAEEWPAVERASCGSSLGAEEEDAAAVELVAWALDVGSCRGSGSGGGCRRVEELDEESPEVLIGSGLKGYESSDFLLLPGGESVGRFAGSEEVFMPGRLCPAAAAILRPAVGGKPSGLYCVPASTKVGRLSIAGLSM